MNQTLTNIPEFLFQWPWLLIWILPLLAIAVWESRRHSVVDVATTYGVPIIALILFSHFILPQVVNYTFDPSNPSQPKAEGVAIRGYGLMMLLGIVAGVLLAWYRGQREGLSVDRVMSLAITLCIAGIVGARLFFVIQYWDRFEELPGSQRLIEMVNMTKGGLVVYGSFIGASLGLIGWCWKHNLHLGKVADLIGPSFLVGLALGRIGCLLNGCCFGGLCDVPQVAFQFPAGSPPFEHQIKTAELIGVITQKAEPAKQNALNDQFFQGRANQEFQPWRKVKEVLPASTAEILGVQIDDFIYLAPVMPPNVPPGITFDKVLRETAGKQVELPPPLRLYSDRQGIQPIDWGMVPQVSQPIHPTQLYSFAAALLLAAVVAFSYRFRRFDGQSFLLMMVLYSIVRYLLEVVRVDEEGQFGTEYSISQIVAFWTFGIGVALLLGGWFLAPKKLPEGELNWSPEEREEPA